MDRQQTKAWWDESMRDNYFTGFQFSFSRPNLIAKFNLGDNSRILEIGFGYGREISQFCEISKHVFGVDLAEDAQNIARRKLIEHKTANMPTLMSYDGTKLPFEDNKFDFIYNCFVIQHMAKKSALELLIESKRVLAPNGKMLFEFFGEKAFYKPGLDQDVFSGTPLLIEPGLPRGGMYNNAYTPIEIQSMASLAGLCIEWIDTQHIGDDFDNYWVCMHK